MAHTIVMYERTTPPGEPRADGTFSDFETLDSAMNGLCRMFEAKLKQESPDSRNIQYDIADLFQFLDSFEDFSMLTFNTDKKAYEPWGIAGIKKKMYDHLRAASE